MAKKIKKNKQKGLNESEMQLQADGLMYFGGNESMQKQFYLLIQSQHIAHHLSGVWLF